MPTYPLRQLDVFSDTPLRGNALAVVHAADGLDEARMATFAHWTQLAETAFLLAPSTPAADYRVRIFSSEREMAFAGHPTLGSCHAWLEAGGRPRGEEIVQECGIGLVRIRHAGPRLAFAAPPLLRQGPLDEAVLARVRAGLGLEDVEIRHAAWVDNGPGWLALMLPDREDVLALQPDYARLAGLRVGVVAPWPGGEADFEVRAFLPGDAVPEDPVTGSLNAGVAQWLIAADLAPSRYVAAQGTVLGRRGRVHVEAVGDDLWIGGDCGTCITGEVVL